MFFRYKFRPLLEPNHACTKSMFEHSSTSSANIAKTNNQDCFGVDVFDETLLPLTGLLLLKVSAQLLGVKKHPHSNELRQRFAVLASGVAKKDVVCVSEICSLAVVVNSRSSALN